MIFLLLDANFSSFHEIKNEIVFYLQQFKEIRKEYLIEKIRVLLLATFCIDD